MLRKTMLLALSVGALIAFAAPTVASAQLKENGVDLAVGAEVTATSTNLETLATGLGVNLTCEIVTLHLKVERNNPGDMELSDVATTIEGCTSPITNPTAGTVTLGGGVGIAHDATFIAAGVCHFEGDIPFSYNKAGGTTLTVTGTEQFDGNCGKGDMKGDFHLETSDGTPVTIHN